MNLNVVVSSTRGRAANLMLGAYCGRADAGALGRHPAVDEWRGGVLRPNTLYDLFIRTGGGPLIPAHAER
jgi:hypothetical protein